MFEIIWGLLNSIVLIYFIIICFKATKVIREKISVLAALIFVFGLFSFMVKPNDENDQPKIIDLQKQDVKKNSFNGNTYSTEFKLEENLATDITLFINYTENSNGITLLCTYANRTGFVSGTNWKVNTVDIKNSKNQNYCHYTISGTVEWRILGLKVYAESKHFDGNAKLKK